MQLHQAPKQCQLVLDPEILKIIKEGVKQGQFPTYRAENVDSQAGDHLHFVLSSCEQLEVDLPRFIFHVHF